MWNEAAQIRKQSPSPTQGTTLDPMPAQTGTQHYMLGPGGETVSATETFKRDNASPTSIISPKVAQEPMMQYTPPVIENPDEIDNALSQVV